MSDDIGPGDFVECINATPGLGVGPYWSLTPTPSVGALYQIERIFSDWDGDAFALVEVPGRYPDGQRFAYDSRRFRKRPPHREALFRSLLEPAHKITEDA